MTTTPTPAELAMARAILAVTHEPSVVRIAEDTDDRIWRKALRQAQAAEKARPVGEVPVGWGPVERAHLEHMIEMVRHPVTHFNYSTGRAAVAWALSALSAAPSPPEGLGE